jgi:hypothetical protein
LVCKKSAGKNKQPDLGRVPKETPSASQPTQTNPPTLGFVHTAPTPTLPMEKNKPVSDVLPPEKVGTTKPTQTNPPTLGFVHLPLTPSFPMETQNPDNEVLSPEEHVKRIVMPIFEQSLKETSKNQTLVGSKTNSKAKLRDSPDTLGTRKKDGYVLYQPHNYRLFFDFSKEKFNQNSEIPNQSLELGIIIPTAEGKNYKTINKTELMYCFDNFNFRVKKNQISVTNKKEHKRWYMIPLSMTAHEEVLSIVKKKDDECKEALKRFMSVFGGASNLKVMNTTCEDKVMHERIIDSLPEKAHFYNKVGKKVYNEQNFEFNTHLYASNYIEEQALESHAPQILDTLGELGESQDKCEKLLEQSAGILTNLSKSQAMFNDLFSKNIKYLEQNNDAIKDNNATTADIVKSMQVFATAMTEHVALVRQLQDVTLALNRGLRNLHKEARHRDDNNLNLQQAQFSLIKKQTEVIEAQSTSFVEALMPWYAKLWEKIRGGHNVKEGKHKL